MFTNGKDREQLERIMRAQDEVDAATAKRHGIDNGGLKGPGRDWIEANREVARAAAIRDRAMDNASDRTLRKALRAISKR